MKFQLFVAGLPTLATAVARTPAPETRGRDCSSTTSPWPTAAAACVVAAQFPFVTTRPAYAIDLCRLAPRVVPPGHVPSMRTVDQTVFMVIEAAVPGRCPRT